MQTLDIRMQQMMGMFQMFMVNQSLGMNQLNGTLQQPPNLNITPIQSAPSPTKSSRRNQSSDSGVGSSDDSESRSDSKRRHKHRKKLKKSSKKRHKDRKHRDKDRERKRDHERSPGAELDAVPIFNDNDLSHRQSRSEDRNRYETVERSE